MVPQHRQRVRDDTSPRRDNYAWVRPLVRWFEADHRPMPWRDDPSPYKVWVSEVMLQQTQVATVIPYFTRFLERFPDLPALARAPLEDVLRAWEGLGYYSRARSMHRAAGEILARFEGRVPGSFEELLTLPGVGRYTAAAVASIAYGEPVPAVDGNVLRVMARFRNDAADVSKPAVRDALFEFLRPAVHRADPSHFNQALMELGALVCTPRRPRCAECPIRRSCRGLTAGRAAELPSKAARKAIPHHEIAVAVIVRRGRLLIQRRPESAMLGGLWEFPGGKREPGEPLEETARREAREETGLAVRVGKPLAPVRHAYSHFGVTLHAFLCASARGKAVARFADEVRWVRPGDLARYPMPRANRRLVALVGDALRPA